MAETTKRDQGEQRERNRRRRRRRRNRRQKTEWYPQFDGTDGLRVSLHRIRKHTARNILKEPFRFQVPPLENFSWEQAFNWTDYDTIEEGTFSRKGGRALRVVSFETMFLDYAMPWTMWAIQPDDPAWEGVPDPLAATQDLRQIMNSGTPFRLIVNQPRLWGDAPDIEMNATLRNVRVEQRAGEVDARYTNVEFVEWRDVDLHGKRKGHHRGLPTRHKIDKHTNRTLRDLGKKYYGEASGWRRIVPANKVLQAQNWPPDRPLRHLARKPPHLHSIYIPKKNDGRLY